MLVVSGKTEAIEALARGWKDRSLYQRCEVVDMLGKVFATEENDSPSWGVQRKSEPEAVRAAEALLGEALGDLAVCEGRRGSLGDYAVLDPRIADFALYALSRNFPRNYKISVTPDLDVREAEREEAVRVWKERSRAARVKKARPGGESAD